MNTKERIIDILKSVDRAGILDVVEYLEESTFFTDPASSNYHHCYEGGLADYSLNVYEILDNYCKISSDLESVADSVKIVGLLHNLAYVGCFQKTYKNVLLKDAEGKNRRDEYGKNIWVEQKGYNINSSNQLYPHGLLSTMTLKKYMKLNQLENLAIHWQNGIYDQPQHLRYTVDRAARKHKMIMYTQFAKKEAQLFHDIGKQEK